MRAIARAYQDRNSADFEKTLKDYKDGRCFLHRALIPPACLWALPCRPDHTTGCTTSKPLKRSRSCASCPPLPFHHKSTDYYFWHDM